MVLGFAMVPGVRVGVGSVVERECWGSVACVWYVIFVVSCGSVGMEVGERVVGETGSV